ncbi:hypothetical protein GCM10008957_32760 [Deinococcus ruber]|uniref:PIN domain-containing protein n=1 Tax=Deinococcus ruber TaxID=1848197 RepID=A0A918CBZ0_9DEIO|nr:hypothetical protein GCM10008957_32760 [Deinococcus ruber]
MTERSLPLNNRKTLPYHELHWKEFELLALDLLETNPDIDFARLYGVEGDAQEGIDIYAPLKGKTAYAVVQCKQVEKFGPAKIRTMIDLFLGITKEGLPVTTLNGKPLKPLLDDQGNEYPRWPTETKTFTLAISRPLNSPGQIRELNDVKRRLLEVGIAFELWDPHRLNQLLRKQPPLIDRHFSRYWVDAFCGPDAAAALGELSPRDRAMLKKLANVQGTLSVIQRHLDVADREGVKLNSVSEDRLVQRLALSLPTHEAATPIAATDPISKELEILRTLIRAGPGAADAAKEKLETLCEPIKAAAPAVQATYHRLMGAFHYNLEQGVAAADAYIQAYELDPLADGATKLMGLAYLLQHDGPLALGYLDQARRKDPADEEAQAMYVEALLSCGREEHANEIERTLTPDQLTLGTTFVRWHMRQCDWERMRHVLAILQRGVHATHPHVRLLTGKLTLHELVQQNRTLHGDLRNRSIQRHPDALAAMEHFNAALAAFDRGDVLQALRGEALNARQVLRCLIGEDRLSLEDGQAALRLDPSLTGVQFDLALAHLRLDDTDGALRVLDRYGPAVLSALPQSRIIFAAAARRSGNALRALELLGDGADITDDALRLDRLNEYVRALIALDRLTEAAAALDAEPSRLPMWHVTRGEWAIAAHNDPEARAAFQAAVEAATDFEAATYRFQYAAYLRSRDDTAGAAKVLTALPWVELPNTWLEIAAKQLYEGQRYVEAQTALVERRTRGEPERMTSWVIEAQLLALDGDLQAAIPIFETAVRRWPEEPFALLYTAAAYTRLGKLLNVRPLLQRLLSLPEVPAWILLKASGIARELLLQDEARQLGYQALRAEYDNEDIHMHFFDVMQAFPERQELKTVRAETAVELERSPGDKFWAVLTADNNPEISRGEHALDTPLARALLGAFKGTCVTTPTGETYRVVRVVSKYVNAERVWLQQGRELFPVSPRMRMMKTGDFEILPSGIWDLLEALQEENQQRRWLVEEQHFPVTLLNQRRRTAEHTIWDWWLEQGVQNEAFSGDPQELTAAAHACQGAGLILHSSALTVLHHTHLFKLLARTQTLYVTRQTLDDLNRAVRQAAEEARNAPLRTMSRSGQGLIITEETKELLEARQKRLEGLQTLVRTRTRVIPVIGLAAYLETQPWAENYLPTTSTFLAAQQRHLPVLCDDLNLLRFAQLGLFGERVEGCTTVTYIDQWQMGGGLAEQARTAALLRLATAGQGPLPHLSRELVARILERSELQRDRALTTVMRTIGWSGTPLSDVAKDVALLLRQGFLHMPIPERRQAWMCEILDQALRHHDLLRFGNIVRSALIQELELAPFLLDEMLDLLRRWQRERWQHTGGKNLKHLA